MIDEWSTAFQILYNKTRFKYKGQLALKIDRGIFISNFKMTHIPGNVGAEELVWSFFLNKNLLVLLLFLLFIWVSS